MKWYAILYKHYDKNIYPSVDAGWLSVSMAETPEYWDRVMVYSTTEELLDKFRLKTAGGKLSSGFFVYEFEVEG